jgi:hypothetical protein
LILEYKDIGFLPLPFRLFYNVYLLLVFLKDNIKRLGEINSYFNSFLNFCLSSSVYMKDDQGVNYKTDPVVAFNGYDYGDEYDDDNKLQKIFHTTIINNETNINETNIISFLIEQKNK